MNKNVRNAVLLVLIPAIIIIAAVGTLGTIKQSETPKYSEIVEKIYSGKITDFNLNLSSGHMEYYEDNNTENKLTYEIPDVSVFYEDVGDFIRENNQKAYLGEEGAKAISYDYSVNRGSWLVSMVPSIILFIGIGVLWYIMMKRMSAGMGNDKAMGFGKAKIKKQSDGGRKTTFADVAGQDEAKEYLVPKGKHITVADGDFVEAGDPLTEGSPELHDILRTRGEKYLARYLVDEIQEVYRFQGVGIDDKHIEVIVRQMLKKVTVLDSGGTSFLVGEQVDKAEFKAENHKAIAEGRQPATAEPLVLGITQASLTTSSFISAASFQETTKALTDAAIRGKSDMLYGLKENVIIGKLIPAGTGMDIYNDVKIVKNENSYLEHNSSLL